MAYTVLSAFGFQGSSAPLAASTAARRLRVTTRPSTPVALVKPPPT